MNKVISEVHFHFHNENKLKRKSCGLCPIKRPLHSKELKVYAHGKKLHHSLMFTDNFSDINNTEVNRRRGQYTQSHKTTRNLKTMTQKTVLSK
jgi:hypothetical protein